MRSGTEQNPNPRSARSHGKFLGARERPAQRPWYEDAPLSKRRHERRARRYKAKQIAEPPARRVKTKPSVRRKRRALRPVDLWTAQMALLRQAAAWNGYADFGSPRQSRSSRQLAMWRALRMGAAR